jgi:hypothetical protein
VFGFHTSRPIIRSSACFFTRVQGRNLSSPLGLLSCRSCLGKFRRTFTRLDVLIGRLLRTASRPNPPVEVLQPCVVPDNSGKSAHKHEDREVPERVVQHASGGAKEDQDPGDLVRDGLLRELDSGKHNDADSRCVQTRQQGIDWIRELLVDL